MSVSELVAEDALTTLLGGSDAAEQLAAQPVDADVQATMAIPPTSIIQMSIRTRC